MGFLHLESSCPLSHCASRWASLLRAIPPPAVGSVGGRAPIITVPLYFAEKLSSWPSVLQEELLLYMLE